jgi:CheY-like chemotaxis protein
MGMSLGKPVIVLADDDENFLQVFTEILVDAGFTVHGAINGRDAFELMKVQKEVSILITDIVMPEMEGLELIRETRKNFPNIKIIALSGGGVGDGIVYLDMALHLGAGAALSKPFEADDLLLEIKKILASVH